MKDANLSVTPFVGKGSNTSLFYATTIQLGPAEVVGQPDVDSKRPYYGFARVGHGQTAGSHFHDGYSLLMFTEGEYEIAGETYKAGRSADRAEGAHRRMRSRTRRRNGTVHLRQRLLHHTVLPGPGR